MAAPASGTPPPGAPIKLWDYKRCVSSDHGQTHKESPCVVCCGRVQSLNIRHVHLSTQYYNKVAYRKGEFLPYCHNCVTNHETNNLDRIKTMLTTSTLAGVPFLEGWEDPGLHMDWESIPGASLVTLRKAWEKSYCSIDKPIDTAVVAGLPDLLELTKPVADYRAPPGGQPKMNIKQEAERIKDEYMKRVSNLH